MCFSLAYYFKEPTPSHLAAAKRKVGFGSLNCKSSNDTKAQPVVYYNLCDLAKRRLSIYESTLYNKGNPQRET
jgi:hypothetical protein